MRNQWCIQEAVARDKAQRKEGDGGGEGGDAVAEEVPAARVVPPFRPKMLAVYEVRRRRRVVYKLYKRYITLQPYFY